MEPIAHIRTPFDTKFGVPRQAGLAEAECRVVFEPKYRVAEAVRGLEEFDYVWLIWKFHLAEQDKEWSPTVRPPRLGGNKRVGVFASRSPFRPNGLGLSSVRLLGVEMEAELGPVLRVSGADMVDGTPIFDIKPYLPYADSHPEARSGFAQQAPVATLRVEADNRLLQRLPAQLRDGLVEALSFDPRPRYHADAQRIYVMPYAGFEVRFRVEEGCAVVVDVVHV